MTPKLASVDDVFSCPAMLTSSASAGSDHAHYTDPPQSGLSALVDCTDQAAVDGTTAALEQLAHLAAEVLNQHTNVHGTCGTCRRSFPCDFATLAEHNLALL